jgi:hypothetical protein
MLSSFRNLEKTGLLLPIATQSLTSCTCSANSLMNWHLMWELESESKISNIQCGFCQCCILIHHLMLLEQNIQNALLTKELSVAVFFDVWMAYNTTTWYGILCKLHKWGQRGSLSVILWNFMMDHQFHVHLVSELSRHSMPNHYGEGTPKKWATTTNCNFQETSPISSRKLVSGLASAHWGNFCLISCSQCLRWVCSSDLIHDCNIIVCTSFLWCQIIILILS